MHGSVSIQYHNYQFHIAMHAALSAIKQTKIIIILTRIHNTHPQLVSSRLSPTCSEAMPKSAILILFLSSSRRFSGFKSLWLEEHRGQPAVHQQPSQRTYFGRYIVSVSLILVFNNSIHLYHPVHMNIWVMTIINNCVSRVNNHSPLRNVIWLFIFPVPNDMMQCFFSIVYILSLLLVRFQMIC